MKSARAVAQEERARARSVGSKNAHRRNLWLLVLTALLLVGSVVLFMPPSEKINQGLDIQGGLSVVLSAESTDGSTVSSEDMETSRAIVESRVNALGASEATVAIQGDNQILVQIPGLSDTQEALNTIGRTGHLEFARLDSFTDPQVVSDIQNGTYISQEVVTDEVTGMQFTSGNASYNYYVEPGTYEPIVTGDNIQTVSVGRAGEVSTDYAVNIKLDSAGSTAFAQASRDLVSTNGIIVILLDGYVQSAPRVQSEIPNGEVQITGQYTESEARALETVLESGSLPVTFTYEQSQTVGPTLGQGALAAGVFAALVGLALVMIYLLIFYKGLGFITAAAMAVFACLYLGILALLSAFNLFSLSLAGIAGVVLTIGMAADSSILTLERFREEIRMGRSVRAASITGVKHGILTSIDADLVTLVSALTLFFLASASVKGFGLTLALGIICDILMMLLFKAPVIRLLAPASIAKHPGFWGVADCQEAAPYYQREKAAGFGQKIPGRFIKKDFNVLGLRKYTLAIAAAVVVIICIFVGIKGVNWGIEFVGGTSVTYSNTGEVTTQQVQDAFEDQGMEGVSVQTTSSDGANGFIIRLDSNQATEAAAAANGVAESFGWSTDDIQISTIGPDWGPSVIKSSLIAFFVSLLLIIAYIAARFRDYKMGVTAVVALLHDLVLVVGIYVLLGQEFTPNTVAALLTILGYSLYDTVVVFHRINENMKLEGVKCSFISMANHSVNEVLVRSLNTSITSLIPVVAMLVFGGSTLHDFALAMTIGLVAGCYSSYAIATPLYCIWKSREPRNARLIKKYGSEPAMFFLNRLDGFVAADLEDGSQDGKNGSEDGKNGSQDGSKQTSPQPVEASSAAAEQPAWDGAADSETASVQPWQPKSASANKGGASSGKGSSKGSAGKGRNSRRSGKQKSGK